MGSVGDEHTGTGLILWWDDRGPGPVVFAATFGSVAGAVPVPRLRTEGGGNVVAVGGRVQATDVDPVAFRDRENIYLRQAPMRCIPVG